MINLRPYQAEQIQSVRSALRRHRNVLMQLPTGGGKTVIASYMLQRVLEKNTCGYFICHRRELVDQTAATFDKVGIEYSYIAAGYPHNPYHNIQVCSIDTLKNRLDKVHRPDVCIWDEAHHLGAAGWAKVHAHYDDAFHVGLSATPVRLDGKGLGAQFDALIPGPTVAWLIEQGFLARYKLYSVPSADLSGLHTRMGEFIVSESEQAMDTSTVTGDIIQHWQQHASDRITIGFAVSIAHSQHIVQQFQAAGIPAAHLDGNTPKDERRATLRALAEGRVRVVWNVGLFGEGYDLAANSGRDVAVGCVIDAAPTQSLGAWLQRCGRALRPQERPSIILDHAGNALRHGMPCEERTWSLEGSEGRNGGNSGEESTVTVKQCKKCFAVHYPAPKCPECGYVYETEGRKIKHVAGTLEEVDPEEIRRQRKREQGQAQDIQGLVAVGRSRGMKNPEQWAQHVLRSRAEKQRLLAEAINLRQAVIMAGKTSVLGMAAIKQMKPKQLREFIAEVKAEWHDKKPTSATG